MSSSVHVFRPCASVASPPCRPLAGGAGAPVDDLGFVDDEPVVISGLQAWPVPYCAVDVYGAATAAAHDVVVVVIDPVLIAGRRARRLDTPDEVIFGQDAQRIVDRLTRDGADVSPHQRFYLVGRSMGPAGHSSHDRQTLCGHLNASPSERVGWPRANFLEHNSTLALILDVVKFGRHLDSPGSPSSVIAVTRQEAA
jgi:hypothetical protein